MSTKTKKILTLASSHAKKNALAKAKFTESDAANLGAKLDHQNADLLGQQTDRLAHPHNPGS
jgi:hypothetical protein